MFCTGAAPTLPGMSERFSMPHRSRSTAHATRSSHSTPASARTATASGVSATTSIDAARGVSSTPSKSCVKRMLLPPASTVHFAGAPFLKKAVRSSVVSNSTSRAAAAAHGNCCGRRGRCHKNPESYCKDREFLLTLPLFPTAVFSPRHRLCKRGSAYLA